jgi:hypothetical protein
MQLRDTAESLLRGWDKLERSEGRPAIIDFDCYPDGPPPADIASRIQVLEQLTSLLDQAQQTDNHWLIGRLTADLTYVRALLGERLPLSQYVERTQGAPANPWPPSYIEQRKQEAIDALRALGIAWGPNTTKDLEQLEGCLTAQETADEIRSEAERLEDAVRGYVGTDAPFTLDVEEVDQDVYWAYWLDGAGTHARLRINLRHAQFTRVRARQLALHEILGHALQAASFHEQAQQNDVTWIRLLSVHAPQQILLEGLAQALPYFVAPDDEQLIARTKLVHFSQLIRGQLHLMVNEPQPIEDCIAYARRHLPHLTDAALGDSLTDRANNIQLRSYLWSYPIGLDWFARLAEQRPAESRKVIEACYRAPLQPSDLEALWPAGRNNSAMPSRSGGPGVSSS